MHSGSKSERDHESHRMSFDREERKQDLHQQINPIAEVSSHRPCNSKINEEINDQNRNVNAHRIHQEYRYNENVSRFHWHKDQQKNAPDKEQLSTDKDKDSVYVPNIIRIGQLRCLKPGNRCKYYHQIGYCLKGDNCPFEHGPDCLGLKDDIEFKKFLQHYKLKTPETFKMTQGHAFKERLFLHDGSVDKASVQTEAFNIAKQRQQLMEKYRQAILKVQEKFNRGQNRIFFTKIHEKLKDVINSIEKVADMSGLIYVLEQCKLVDELLALDPPDIFYSE